MTQVSFNFVARTSGYITLNVEQLSLSNDPAIVAQPITSLTDSYLLNVQPQNEDLSPWELAAWKALEVGTNRLVPGDPINRNRRITELYADLFNNQNPGLNPFEWAGMAAFASYQAGSGEAQAISMKFLGQVAAAPNLPPPLAPPDAAKLLDYLAQGNTAIFMDMYPQMLAYQAGGMANITAMGAANQISPVQLAAWTAIDNGIKVNDPDQIFSGSTIFGQTEQEVTLQAILDKDLPLWANATTFIAAPWIKSPIPGDSSTFQSFAPGVSFGDGNARYNWFAAKMVPAWRVWRQNNATINIQKLLSGGYQP